MGWYRSTWSRSRGRSETSQSEVFESPSRRLSAEFLRNGQVDKVLEFFETTPDDFACSYMIWLFIKDGDVRKALEAIDISEGVGLVPVVKTYNALIKLLCKVGEVDRALNVLESMKAAPDVITYTTILNGLCKNRKLEQALNLLDNMKVAPNAIMYNTILDGLCKDGFDKEAEELRHELRVRGVIES